MARDLRVVGTMGLFRRAKSKQKLDAVGDEFSYVDDGDSRPQRKRSLRRGESRHERTDQGGEDERFDQSCERSLGEDLAPGDQFDLYVPIKAHRTKSILRHPGVFGGSHHHPRSPGYKGEQSLRKHDNEYEGGLEETSTVSSLTVATLDNSTEAKYSGSQTPALSTGAGKSALKRNTTTGQRREQPDMTTVTSPREVTAESPTSACNLACCGPDAEQSEAALRDGDRNLGMLAGDDLIGLTKEEDDERDPVEAHKNLPASQRHNHVNSTSQQAKTRSRRESEGHGWATPALEATGATRPSKTGNDAIGAAPTSQATSPVTNPKRSSGFPACLLAGLCGPREVSDVDISDDTILSPSVTSSPRTAAGAFRSYERPSAAELSALLPLQRETSLFDPTLTEDEADECKMSKGTSRWQQQQSREQRRHHHNRGGHHSTNNTEQDEGSVHAYDSEVETAVAVAEMDNRRGYQWWGGNGDHGNSTDEQIDCGRAGDGHYICQLEGGDDAGARWKVKLPRVRSIPKIGKIGRPRSFQKNSTSSATGRGSNVSRGRSRTTQITSAPTEDNRTSGGRRRSRSRSRSRGRAVGSSFNRPPPVKTAAPAAKDRRSRLPAGKEIDPMDLF